MPITHLLFDLDGTLYPQNNGIWEAIAARMEDYMHTYLGFSRAEIPGIREGYYHQYGTTLKGLIVNHNIDPYAYLRYVHDIPLGEYISQDTLLAESLARLDFPKWIFTNADVNHAARVLEKLGVSHFFEGILGVNSLNFVNKPEPGAYQAVLEILNSPAPQNCIFIDDIPKNLIAAKQYGMHTILVGSRDPAPEIDRTVPNAYHLPPAVASITGAVV
jgi:putative hydrolase of the HAD superfamily